MIKERLKQYLKLKHLSIRTFEKMCGIGQSVLSKITTEVSEDTLGKIEKYSDLNLEWLMTGNGNMIDVDRNPQIISVTGNGVQASGDFSTVARDIKIELTEKDPPQTSRKRQPSIAGLQKEIERLNTLVSKAHLEIAKLEGKIEQQNDIIKMLLGK